MPTKSKKKKKSGKSKALSRNRAAPKKKMLTANPITIMYPSNGQLNIPVNFTANGTTDPNLGEVEVGGIVSDVAAMVVYLGTPATQPTTGSLNPPDWFITFPDEGALPANTDLVLTAYITDNSGTDQVNFRTGAAFAAPAPHAAPNLSGRTGADEITLTLAIEGSKLVASGKTPYLSKPRVLIVVAAGTGASGDSRAKIIRGKADGSYEKKFSGLAGGRYLITAMVLHGRNPVSQPITIGP